MESFGGGCNLLALLVFNVSIFTIIVQQNDIAAVAINDNVIVLVHVGYMD